MRQADSTIKGYLYQFNKSILEILNLADDDSLVLEGVIEDIDIISPSSTTTIQCKYHEEKKYVLSSVAVPIIEMFANFCEASYVGKKIKYILFAYFVDNAESIEIADFYNFLITTQDKEIITKYFHKIFNICDKSILNIANKPKKTISDKETLILYYQKSRGSLTLRADINSFWSCFQYVKAAKYDSLKESVLAELARITDLDTAKTLYYPNAFSYIALLSSKNSVSERTISKKELIEFLKGQKNVLLNRWALEAFDRKNILKNKRDSLVQHFASNPDVRSIVFSDTFLRNNEDCIIPFIRDYIGKYFKKPKLQKPPIFVFGDKSSTIMQDVIMGLYNYQLSVHTGNVGAQFVLDSFINNKNSPDNYVCKITSTSRISSDVLEQCSVNQLFIIGSVDIPLASKKYYWESLPVSTIKELRYLVGLSKYLEE